LLLILYFHPYLFRRFLAAAGAQYVEPLGQHLFEIGDGAPLHEHVPVGARGLDLLGLRRRSVDQQRRSPVEAALPRGGNLGLLGEGHLEFVAAFAAVGGDVARCGLRAVLGLVTDRAEPTAPQCAVCHRGHEFQVPFSEEAEIPTTWECRLDGSTALLIDGPAPETKKVKAPRTHWDMLMERRTIADLEEVLAERLDVLRARRGQKSA